jgi:hypothetical protein
MNWLRTHYSGVKSWSAGCPKKEAIDLFGQTSGGSQLDETSADTRSSSESLGGMLFFEVSDCNPFSPHLRLSCIIS